MWQKGRGKVDRNKCKEFFCQARILFTSSDIFLGGKKNETAQLIQNTTKHLATK